MSVHGERRFISLPNIGGLLLGLAALWLLSRASEATGGRCGPLPPQAAKFGLFVLAPALWSAVDLVRGVLARRGASVLGGAVGLVVGLWAIGAYEVVQHCRN